MRRAPAQRLGRIVRRARGGAVLAAVLALLTTMPIAPAGAAAPRAAVTSRLALTQLSAAPSTSVDEGAAFTISAVAALQVGLTTTIVGTPLTVHLWSVTAGTTTDLGLVTTAADGSFSTAVVLPPGRSIVSAQPQEYEGTPGTVSALTLHVRGRSTLAVTTTSALSGQATVTGTLTVTSTGAAVAQAAVTLSAVNGTRTATARTTTDATGAFSASIPFYALGTWHVDAQAAATSVSQATSGSGDIAVTKGVAPVTLWTFATRNPSGSPDTAAMILDGGVAQIGADVPGATGAATVSFYVTPRGGKRHLLLTRHYLDGADQTSLSSSVVVDRRSTLEVVYSGDGIYTSGSQSVGVRVRPLLDVAPTASSLPVKKGVVQMPRTKAKVTVSSQYHLPSGRLRLDVQQRVKGRWVTLTRRWVKTPHGGDDSTWGTTSLNRLVAKHGTKRLYRVRTVWTGDSLVLKATSSWMKVHFTRS